MPPVLPLNIDHPPATPVDQKTLRDAFCRKQACSDEDFLRRAFWRTLYPQAWPLALLAGHRAERFSADRALIAYCGRLTSLHQIDAELAEFSALVNRSFVRRSCRLRVSGRRLKKLAAEYLPP